MASRKSRVKVLDDLEAQRQAKAKANRKAMNPRLLAFLDECRVVFGDVRLHKGKAWQGGSR